VVLISETAKHSDRPGGLLATLPLVTLLIRVKPEGQTQAIIVAHVGYLFFLTTTTDVISYPF